MGKKYLLGLGLFVGLAVGMACDPEEPAQELTREEFASQFDEKYCDWWVDCGMGCPLNGWGGQSYDSCVFDPQAGASCLETVDELYGELSCGLTPPDIGPECKGQVLTQCEGQDDAG